jgi:steroid delta-isomerase-like uncharacterized protein
LARQAIEMLARHDLDGLERCWHDDIVEDFVAVGVFHGKREVRRFFDEMLTAFADFAIEIETLIGDDSTAFVSWRVTGTFAGGPFQGVAPTGAVIELRGTDRMEFAGAKMVRNTVYYDGMSFARAVGMMPAAGSAAEGAMKSAFNAVTAVKQRIGL